MTPPSEQSAEAIRKAATVIKHAFLPWLPEVGEINEGVPPSIEEIAGMIRAALSAAPAPEPEHRCGMCGGAIEMEEPKTPPADDAETFTSEANVYIQWMKDRGLWGTADTPTDADLRALVDTVRADERRKCSEACRKVKAAWDNDEVHDAMDDAIRTIEQQGGASDE